MTLSRRLFKFENEIRDELKAIVAEAKAAAQAAGVRFRGHPSSVKFSVAGHAKRQSNARKVVAESGFDRHFFDRAVHEDFDSLDRGPRKSVACAYEQFRIRLAALVLAAPALSTSENLHTVTIADRRHRVPHGQLHMLSPTTVTDIVKDIHLQLARGGIVSKAFGVVEISCDDTDEGTFFEPHVHAVISGPSNSDLQAAISRGNCINPMVDSIYHLKGHLLYLTKFQAETRSLYEDARGNRGRRRNKMAPSERAEWLSYYARHGLSELLICRGFQPNLMREFLTAEMDDLLDEFIGRRSRTPSRWPQRPNRRSGC